MSAVVIMGEAPESDEDEVDSGSIVDNQMVGNNRPETPPSPSPDYPRSKDELIKHQPSSNNNQQKSVNILNANKSSHPSASPSSYDTLLQSKLREKNEQLREELIKMACQPYLNATEEIDSLSQQLIKSQRMVKQVSETLANLTKEVKKVEIALDNNRMDFSVIPQFTDKLTQRINKL